MAEEQRRQIEQLMGRENGSSITRDPEMTSSRVCRAFLVGTCPHDLFVGTKQDLGKCPNLHLQKHKLEYEHRTKKLGEKFPDIEYDYYKIIGKYVSDLDRNINNAQLRLQHTPEEKAKIAKVTKELDDLDVEIGLMVQELNYLIAGDQATRLVEHSIQLEKKCEEREKLSQQARKITENVGQSSQQKLQVCDGCGAYLSRLDNDRRLADHFVGKIHMGYVQLRENFKEQQQKYRKEGKST
ncbi:LUC7 Protein LUC7 [Candida maltosa Xu316]